MQFIFYLTAIAFFIFPVAGYALLRLAALPIDALSVLLIGSFLVSGLLLAGYTRTQNVIQAAPPQSHRQRLLAALPYLTFLPIIIAVFFSTGLQVSNHGDIHAGYVIQIQRGVGIPENPFVFGDQQPANYYWLYHMLIATFAHLLYIPAPTAAAIINFIALFSVLFWIRKALDILEIRYPPLVMGFAVIATAFSVNLFKLFHDWVRPFFRGEVQGVLSIYAPLLFSDNRLTTNFVKFSNYTSFPLGMMYFTVALYATLALTRGRSQFTVVNILLLTAGIGAGFAYQLGVGVFTVVTLLPALVLVYLFQHGTRLKARLQEDFTWALAQFKLAEIILLPVFALVAAGLMAHYLSSVLNPNASPGSISFNNPTNAVMLISAMYPLLPFFILGIIAALRRRNYALIFLGLAVAAGYCLTYFMVIRGDNQYKFVLLTTPIVAVVTVWFLSTLTSSTLKYQRYLGWFFLSSMSLLVLLNIGQVSYTRFNRAFNSQPGMIFNGPYLESANFHNQDVLNWLRENTPSDTIVVLQLDMTRYMALLSNRTPYVVEKQFSFVEGLSAYEARVNDLTQFYDEGLFPDSFHTFASQHPLVFMVPKSLTLTEQQAAYLELQYTGTQNDIYLYKPAPATQNALGISN